MVSGKAGLITPAAAAGLRFGWARPKWLSLVEGDRTFCGGGQRGSSGPLPSLGVICGAYHWRLTAEGKGWSAFWRLAKLRAMQSEIAAQNTQELIYTLRSITERLELTDLFSVPQPLEVELGCGDASFLVEYARQHPEINFLGVERLLGRLRKLDRKGRRSGAGNLRGVRIESSYLLEYLLPPNVASALHIYFPDPWPKKKHRRHRLINERFPALAWQVLTPGGVVYLRTDDEDYFGQMVAVFTADPRFKPVPTPLELASVLTDFEREFNTRGIATRRAAYQRD